jgi:hypothetical protein
MAGKTCLDVSENAQEFVHIFNEWMGSLPAPERECIDTALKNAVGCLDKVGALSARVLVASTLFYLDDRRTR